MGVTTLTILALTALVALISSQISFDEMSETLHQQSVHFTQNLIKDSVPPLLYGSKSGAADI